MNIDIPTIVFYGYYRILKKEHQNLCEDIKFSCIRNEIVKVLREDSGVTRKVTKEICIFCGTNEDIFPHHKDGDHSNNNPENTILVCRACHMLLHKRIERQAIGGCKKW